MGLPSELYWPGPEADCSSESSVEVKNVWSYTLIRHIYIYIYKLRCSRYRPGVAQMVGWGIAPLFHDRSTRREWVVGNTPRPHFTPGKGPVSILQEAGWAPGPVWTGGKSRPHRESIPDRPARGQSLYRLSYPAHYIYSRHHAELSLGKTFITK